MTKKRITVFGATGAQDGGLVRAIHQDSLGEFAVRTVTRHANSAQVQEWAHCGAEVVEADLDDAASIRRVMHGAHGGYCVTFFRKHFSLEKELAEALTLAEATKSKGVRHVIWSTLEDSRQWVPLFNNRMFTLMCKYKVSYLDAKGEGNYFFTDLRVTTTTFLLTSFYWEDFIHFGMSPKPGPDGQLFGMAAEDTGWCSLDIFKQRTALIGNIVGITDEQLTSQEMVAGLSKALGFPVADNLGNMFQAQRNLADDSLKARSMEFSRQLNSDLQSFDTWLAIHARKIPLEMQAALRLWCNS